MLECKKLTTIELFQKINERENFWQHPLRRRAPIKAHVKHLKPINIITYHTHSVRAISNSQKNVQYDVITIV